MINFIKYQYFFLTLRAAAMTLRTVLLSLQALLAAAEPDDPQDAVVARQYKEDPEMFKLTARHWAQAYAGGNYQVQLCIDFIIHFVMHDICFLILHYRNLLCDIFFKKIIKVLNDYY